MQVKKEEIAGKMYLGYQYSAGILQRHTPKQRAARKKVTAEGKRNINAIRRRTMLMMLMSANFEPGRDLFIEVGFAEEPDEKTATNALRGLHRRIRKNVEREGLPVRLHYHIIMTWAGGPALEAIREAWGMGGVDVRALRELSENFEDTCNYLLKEEKPKGKRAYSTSTNLARPPEPLRRRVPEAEAGEVPPGVKLVWHKLYGDEYGQFEIIMGKIIDQRAFDQYWRRVQLDRRRVEEARNWRRYAAERRRHYLT